MLRNLSVSIFNLIFFVLVAQRLTESTLQIIFNIKHSSKYFVLYTRIRILNFLLLQVLPILEILYHVEERNSHHVYMALIILLILTEDDAFNRSIHEVVCRSDIDTCIYL